MRGDEDVWKTEQPSEVIVLQHLAGEIFEEDAFLLFVNIERDAAEMAAFNASIRGFVSTSAPRLTLTMIVPGLVSSIVSRLTM